MINKYEQTKVAAYIKMLEGTLDYWRNELARIESEPVAKHIEEAGPIDPDAFDKLKSMKNARPNGPTKLSISSLWELFKSRHKLKDPLDSGHAIVFAKYIRELTIDETVTYVHAEPEPPGSTAGTWTASAFLICRPDKDNINLPKDYQL